jgi:hypothetical protein
MTVFNKGILYQVKGLRPSGGQVAPICIDGFKLK